jgi:deoxycitidine kinase
MAPPPTPPPVRVCVEGNIGCGKSTALRRLAALRPDVAVHLEPVEEWGDLLDKYYQDPVQWGLALQLRALLAYDGDKSGVTERGPLSSRHVFAQLLFNDGKMTQAQWDLYKDYADVLGWTPDVVVYVHTPPDVCHERVRQRGRDAERGVDLHYLKRIEFQYETMLRYADAPVVRLDGTTSPDALAAAIAEVADQARIKAGRALS